MPKQVHRDASSAWRALCATGGIELNGRDIDLEDKLKRGLSSSAPTLEDALLGATTDQLLRTLFEVAQPFVQMFSDILEFFEAACAKEGRSSSLTLGHSRSQTRQIRPFHGIGRLLRIDDQGAQDCRPDAA
jgi:hypothetical protein